MRPPRRLVLALLAVTAAAAGCGGSEVSPDEVPGAPPTLTVPTDPGVGGGGTDATTTGETSSSTTDPATTADTTASTGDATTGTDTGITEPATTTEDTSGGTGTTVEPAPEAAAETQAPPADTNSQQFEDFCEQNAGAC